MQTHRIECLDGLRGLAAAWVVIGHAMILSGFLVPIIASPDLAVDLFMMLSGFLMAFHYQEREIEEPWSSRTTWLSFWTRRLFRIAPLYYVLLVVALVIGPSLGQFRDHIALAVPGIETVSERYTDQSLANVIEHLTFIFGFSPHYSFLTPLPDWSIGLEMAFYFVFPFLMILVSKIGFLVAGASGVAVCFFTSMLFPAYFNAFKEPSFLLIKLPIFLAGMLVAASLRLERKRSIHIVAAVLFCLVPIHGDGGNHRLGSVIRIFSILSLAMLADCRRMPALLGLAKLVQRLSSILGGRVATFLGDTSYCVYLLHLLVMLPILDGVVVFLHPAHPVERFLLTIGIVIPTVYAPAWILHFTIEKRGIAYGRKVLKLIKPNVPKPLLEKI